jgi:hypothetical protein
MPTKRQLWTMFTAMVLLAVFGISGEMDKQDLLRERASYCEMVRNKLWPDYRQTFKTECKISGDVSPDAGKNPELATAGGG